MSLLKEIIKETADKNPHWEGVPAAHKKAVERAEANIKKAGHTVFMVHTTGGQDNKPFQTELLIRNKDGSKTSQIIKEDAAAGATSAGAVAAVPQAIGSAQKNEAPRKKKGKMSLLQRLQLGTTKVSESARVKNEHGDSEYTTYAGWRRAIKEQHPGCHFRGDKDIAGAQINGHDVGEWDGAVGWVAEKKAVTEAAEDDTYDEADVISKLKTAERDGATKDNTTAFALEDSEGNIVKVYVSADQANDFEKALSAELSGADKDDDNRNSNIEIAEVLFNLRDKFDIVDVVYPKIPEDEETDMSVGQGGEEANGLDVGAEGEAGPAGADLSDDMTAGATDDNSTAASALTQVIDMMKADAEARKAEAQADAAKYAAQAAESKIKQEEDILDMESYYDDKKKEKDEAKRLAQLAKYKHDLSADEANDIDNLDTDIHDQEDLESAPEEEEEVQVKKAKNMDLSKLADILIHRLHKNK